MLLNKLQIYDIKYVTLQALCTITTIKIKRSPIFLSVVCVKLQQFNILVQLFEPCW